MKNSLKILVVLFSLILVFAQPASALETPQANTIETSATGVVTVEPDVVQLSLTVRTEESSGALAEEKNAIAVNKAIDLLSKEGLDKDEIKTTNYSTYSYLKTDPNKNADTEIKVYSTSSGLEVTMKELNKVGEILDQLANITEVNVNSVNYSIQNPEKYKEQVIDSAIAGAKQNILYSAKALGVELDKLAYLRIDFSPNLGIQPYIRGAVAPTSSAIPQPQNPDKITISATADMSYSVK
ncbi:MAG: SIMPL domain-containing protein [Desulfosporosinus sp.]|nr:SIMPL domain-containing protein [Desulfosporosinus sp.]